MTREEAKHYLSVPSSTNGSGRCTDEQHYEAKQIAIKALEQEPCDDAISRQAVIDVIDEEWLCNEDYDFRSLAESIEQLPSVRPQEQTGHWITQWNVVHQKEYYYCSECREEFSYDGETGIKMNDYDFCPNCGVRMVEPQESEEA